MSLFISIFTLLMTVTSAEKGYIVVAGGTPTHGNMIVGPVCYNAEVLDTESGIWTTLTDIPYAAKGVTLAESEGNVIALAGYPQPPGKATFHYNAGQNSWDAIGPLPGDKSRGAASATVDGTIYVVGGYDATNTLAILPKGSPTWTTGANSSFGHFWPGVAAYEKKIYACGPLQSDTPSNVCEVYDTTTNTWSTGVPMKMARDALGMATLNGYVYAIGGAIGNSERFDPVKQVWSYISSPIVATKFSGVISDGQYLYMLGGTTVITNDVIGSVERYNPSLDMWQEMGYSLSYPRSMIGAVFVPANATPSTFLQ